MNGQQQVQVLTQDASVRARPSSHDAGVLAVAADAMLPAFEEWLGESLSPEDAEHVRELLRDGMRYHTDAFDFAREFERAGWEPNGALVDVLESADSELYQAHRVAVRAWIAETGATPRLAVGALVVLPSGTDAGTPGEIVAVDARNGEYTVFCESLGHVRDGLGTHGRIFPWETLEAAQ